MPHARENPHHVTGITWWPSCADAGHDHRLLRYLGTARLGGRSRHPRSDQYLRQGNLWQLQRRGGPVAVREPDVATGRAGLVPHQGLVDVPDPNRRSFDVHDTEPGDFAETGTTVPHAEGIGIVLLSITGPYGIFDPSWFPLPLHLR